MVQKIQKFQKKNLKNFKNLEILGKRVQNLKVEFRKFKNVAKKIKAKQKSE